MIEMLTNVVVTLSAIVILVAIAMSVSKALHSHPANESGETTIFAARETPEPHLSESDTVLSIDVIREIVAGAVAVLIVMGCFYLLAFVPDAPKEIVTMALGAILYAYFQKLNQTK